MPSLLHAQWLELSRILTRMSQMTSQNEARGIGEGERATCIEGRKEGGSNNDGIFSSLSSITSVVVILLAVGLACRFASSGGGFVSSWTKSAAACPEVNSIERSYWQDLTPSQRRCLETRNPNRFTEQLWDCGWTDEDFVPWSQLSESRKKALQLRRYDEEDWEMRRTSSNPCGLVSNTAPAAVGATASKSPQDINIMEEAELIAKPDDFNKLVIIKDHPPLKGLSDLSLDRLAEMYNDVPMRFVDGQAGAYSSEEFLEEITIGEFVKEHIKKGDTSRYLHLEEYMEEKTILWDGVGKKAITAIRNMVSHHPVALQKKAWNPEYDDALELGKDLDWAMFAGSKGSSTSMHYDSDTFNCLYVIEGRKRVVVIPNDRRTVTKFNIETNEDAGTGWTGLDILFDLPRAEQLLNSDGITAAAAAATTTDGTEEDDDEKDDNSSDDDQEAEEKNKYEGKIPIVEVILEPGDAIIFPYLAWHAVENLEPSLAVSLRII